MTPAAAEDAAAPDPRFASCVAAIRWGARMIAPAVEKDLAESGGASDDLATRESRWLLEAAAVAAGRDPLFLSQPELSSRVVAVFRSHVARRARGEPLAYVVGEASFMGLDLFVTPDVLVPRPETERLVELALERLPGDAPRAVLDQGTGSGAIAVAIALARPRVTVTAIDCSESALALAERNARRHGLESRVRCVLGDLFPVGEEKYDLLVANLPYIADAAVLPGVVAEWEPRRALRAGTTGTELVARSLALAPSRMNPGATLLYEIGDGQEYGDGVEYRQDLSGRVRYCIKRLER